MRLCLFLLVVVGAHPAKSIPSARRERSSPPLASHISQLIGNLRREHATIAEIMEMSRQQRELQRAAEAARARRDWKYAPPRTIVVANRLPLSVKRDADGQLQYLMTGGGMVSALMGVRDVRMIWVGCTRRHHACRARAGAARSPVPRLRARLPASGRGVRVLQWVLQ